MADVLGAIARATPEEIAILQETFAEDYEKFRHRKRVFRANEEE
jgi:hypothetical protein